MEHMFDDLRDLVDMIDELEDEMWRQRQLTEDPKLKAWCDTNTKYVTRMKDELESYIENAEAAGDVLS